MPLKIVKASDPIEVTQLVACVYALPGLGKTSLGYTCDAPLILDFDGGAYRAANRGDTVQVHTWAEVADITAKDLAGYKTLVVDTSGRALDSLTLDIINRNPKLGNGGALTLQGYGALKAQFVSWTKMVRAFGLDVLLLAHSDEQRKGEDVIERLDMQGGSKNEVYKTADVMGRLSIRNGKRLLNFDPSDAAFGKNPAALEPDLEVPNFAVEPQFFGKLLAQIKAKINEQSAVQKEAATMLADWKAKIEEAKTLEDYNKLVPEVAGADKLVRDNVKRVLVAAGKKAGYEFDKTAKAFTKPAPAAKATA